MDSTKTATRSYKKCLIPLESDPPVLNDLMYVGNRGVGNLRLIGLVGLGPASRVFTCSLLDRLLTASTPYTKMPHMTSYSNNVRSGSLKLSDSY